MENDVEIFRRIEQVVDGIRYEGSLEFAKTVLNYSVRFSPAIQELLALEAAIVDKNGIQKCVQIVVQKNDIPIELSLEEYFLFLTILIDLVMDFYDNPLARNAREKRPDIMTQINDITLNKTASIGMVDVGFLNLKPEHRLMLSAPKFGCTFAA